MIFLFCQTAEYPASPVATSSNPSKNYFGGSDEICEEELGGTYESFKPEGQVSHEIYEAQNSNGSLEKAEETMAEETLENKTKSGIMDKDKILPVVEEKGEEIKAKVLVLENSEVDLGEGSVIQEPQIHETNTVLLPNEENLAPEEDGEKTSEGKEKGKTQPEIESVGGPIENLETPEVEKSTLLLVEENVSDESRQG